MLRTFKHRFTIGEICGVILFLAASFYTFWNRWIVVGIVMVIALVLTAENGMHTEYVFSDGKLIIKRGRLLKAKVIDIKSISKCIPVNGAFGLSRYLIILYNNGKRTTTVEPENEEDFIKCLKRHMLVNND